MLLPAMPGSAGWPAAMIVWGPGFTSAVHRHHCVQLVLALGGGSLRVRGGPAEPWRECGAALVRPDAWHEVDAREGTILIGFVDAESELGAALCETIDGDIAAVHPGRVARWREVLGARPTGARVERWVSGYLLHRRRSVTIDPRLQCVLMHLRRRLATAEDLSLRALAVLGGMSPSRLMHLFTESLGVPLRPYIRWLRVQRAACELMDGATVSMAAHRAGFADAAHLTRTFRHMLGTTPSDLALRRRLSTGVSIEAEGPGSRRRSPAGAA
jgi:AraC-like DNA-binding protein